MIPAKREWLVFVPPWVLGTILRLYQLPTQILVDDEWHLVHRLRGGGGLTSLATDFGISDHSIGLGVCTWLIMQLTSVDELMLRLPSLLAGQLIVVLVPALLASLIGREAGIVLAWGLAVSPLLCFFSRLARPYAITTLLTCLAGVAFYRWFITTGKSHRSAWWYLLSASLAPLFHLAALPAVLAPASLVVLARLFPPPSPLPSYRQITCLLLGTAGMMLLFLTLPALHSAGSVVTRLHADQLQPSTLPGLVELLVGSGRTVVVAVVGAFAGIGIVALARRDRLLTTYLLTVIAAQLAALVAAGPLMLHVPIVAARYLVIVLPLLWIFPAVGLVAVARRVGALGSAAAAHTLGATTAAALVALGPLGWIYWYPNDFTNHMSYQADYVPDRYFERFRPTVVSPFYAELATRPAGSVTIVEAPWFYYFHGLAYAQRRHRQHVLIGFVDDHPVIIRDGEVARTDPGIRLRRTVHLSDLTTLKEKHVDFVVLHRHVLQEMRWPTGVTEVPVVMKRWETRYRRWFGPPVFEDAQLVVFSTAEEIGSPAGTREKLTRGAPHRGLLRSGRVTERSFGRSPLYCRSPQIVVFAASAVPR